MSEHSHEGHHHGHSHDVIVKKVEKISATRAKLTIEFAEKTVKEHEQMMARRFANSVRIPGFRPGKAPISMILSKYQDEIRKEMLTHLVEAGLHEALEKSQLNPISQPSIKFNKVPFQGAGFEFDAEFDVEPSIELKKYKGVPVKPIAAEVDEAEVTKTLDNIRERMAVLEPLAGDSPKKGDFVVVDLGFEFPEVAKKNEAPKPYTVEVGVGKIFPELDEAILKMKVGESQKVEATFPAESQDKEIAGKKVIYDCKLVELKQKNLPPLDDALAGQLKEGGTLQSLSDEIRQNIRSAKEEEGRRDQRNAILDYLSKNHTFEVPSSMIESQAKSMVQWMEQDMKSKGMPPMQWKDQELKEVRDRAERMVRNSLLLKEIAVQEKITLDEQKLQAKIDELAVQMNRTSDETRKLLSGRGLLDRMKDEILTDQIFDFLISNAEVGTKR